MIANNPYSFGSTKLIKLKLITGLIILGKILPKEDQRKELADLIFKFESKLLNIN